MRLKRELTEAHRIRENDGLRLIVEQAFGQGESFQVALAHLKLRRDSGGQVEKIEAAMACAQASSKMLRVVNRLILRLGMEHPLTATTLFWHDALDAEAKFLEQADETGKRWSEDEWRELRKASNRGQAAFWTCANEQLGVGAASRVS